MSARSVDDAISDPEDTLHPWLWHFVGQQGKGKLPLTSRTKESFLAQGFHSLAHVVECRHDLSPSDLVQQGFHDAPLALRALNSLNAVASVVLGGGVCASLRIFVDMLPLASGQKIWPEAVDELRTIGVLDLLQLARVAPGLTSTVLPCVIDTEIRTKHGHKYSGSLDGHIPGLPY